jgi:hypothetical protein
MWFCFTCAYAWPTTALAKSKSLMRPLRHHQMQFRDPPLIILWRLWVHWLRLICYREGALQNLLQLLEARLTLISRTLPRLSEYLENTAPGSNAWTATIRSGHAFIPKCSKLAQNHTAYYKIRYGLTLYTGNLFFELQQTHMHTIRFHMNMRIMIIYNMWIGQYISISCKNHIDMQNVNNIESTAWITKQYICSNNRSVMCEIAHNWQQYFVNNAIMFCIVKNMPECFMKSETFHILRNNGQDAILNLSK